MSIRDLREKINLFIYDSKPMVLRILSALNVLVSLSAIGVMVVYYGFPLSEATKDVCFAIIEGSFGFYILRYLVRLFYDFHPPTFIRKFWFETIIITLLLIEGIAYNFFGTMIIEPLFRSIGFTDFGAFSMIFVQLFVFIIILNNLLIEKKYVTWFKIHPALLFMMSIGIMSFVGSLLLMLPEMSTVEGGLRYVDSLFISTSSVSVTGLAPMDIAEGLTFKGQLVVLILIKLGGLNTIAFGALMLVVAKFGVGIKYHEVIEDFLNRDSLLKSKSMLAKIVIWATTIELIGIVLLFIGFGNQGIFESTGERIFQSVFHGVSAFNNAGLSTFTNGLMHPDVINNTFTHSIILVLLFLGGFGMVYLFDIFEVSRLKERMKYPWKTIGFGTKISLYFTLFLLFFGAIIFFLFEGNNSLQGRGILDKVVFSLFQAMTPRTAGFNLVDTSGLSVAVLLIFLFLMFVGASSGSAGGGIRTSTFAILWASLVSTIKGRKHVELFYKTISNELVLKAYAVLILFIFLNILGSFGLAVTETHLLASGQFDFMDIVFEQVSAASSVGLSTGLTPFLSDGGKYVLIMSMFIGRVGTLTIAYLIGARVISKNYKYPNGHTMVG